MTQNILNRTYRYSFFSKNHNIHIFLILLLDIFEKKKFTFLIFQHVLRVLMMMMNSNYED